MIIGITGSSGAGKSTICEILKREYNVKIINADQIAKRLSNKGTNYMKDIIKTFGNDIVDDQGELRRKKLAEIIYNNTKKREELNNCTFKYIRKEIKNQISKTLNGVTIIIDAPLLFECELEKLCDKVIGVISQKKLQIERIIKRDGINYNQAQKRLNAQENNEFYIERCDVIIENNNDIFFIEKEIRNIADEYGINKIN